MGCRGVASKGRPQRGQERRHEACTRVLGGECQERSPRGSGVSGHSGAGGSLAPVRAFISPLPQDPKCPPWSGQRGPTQQPSPCPTRHRPAGPRFQAGVPAGQGPRSLAERRCVLSQPFHPKPGSAPSPWEGGMLPNRKHELRTFPPSCSPRVLSCLPPPTPTPGMVLSSADQNFMVQKPPEGKGRRGR